MAKATFSNSNKKDMVYVIGREYSKRFQMYDTVNDVWTEGPDLKVQTRDGMCEYSHRMDRVYLFGGREYGNCYHTYSDAIYYSYPNGNEWRLNNESSLSDPIIGAYAVTVSNMDYNPDFEKIYIIGGWRWTQYDKYLNTTQIFDPFFFFYFMKLHKLKNLRNLR